MKIVATIARYLLGLIFLVFGLNHYLNFIPMPMPTGVTGQFFGVLVQTHYLYVVAFLEIIPAILLLANRYIPLALTVLAPVIVNILLVASYVGARPSGGHRGHNLLASGLRPGTRGIRGAVSAAHSGVRTLLGWAPGSLQL